jgi:hypothetical protein
MLFTPGTSIHSGRPWQKLQIKKYRNFIGFLFILLNNLKIFERRKLIIFFFKYSFCRHLGLCPSPPLPPNATALTYLTIIIARVEVWGIGTPKFRTCCCHQNSPQTTHKCQLLHCPAEKGHRVCRSQTGVQKWCQNACSMWLWICCLKMVPLFLSHSQHTAHHIYHRVMTRRGIVRRPIPVILRVRVSCEMKPNFFAKTNECGVCFFFVYRLKVPVRKIQYCFAICVVESANHSCLTWM